MSRKAIRKRTSLEEWQEVRLGDVCSFFSGGTPSRSNPGYYGGNIPFIGSGDIKYSSVNQFITERALRNSSAKLVRKGDLLYALYGATSGETAISKMDGAINQAVLCIQTEENKEFIYNYLLMQKKYILKTYLQGGQGNLSAHIVKSLRILLPPLPEQQAIAETLQTWDTAIEKTEKLITKKEKQLGWLKNTLLKKAENHPGTKMMSLSALLNYEQPTKYIVRSTEYVETGRIPVLTANQSFILGYTNEKEGVYDKHPVIIFDDFTTDIKYVNFPFKVKSSAMKILTPKDNKTNLAYIFAAMSKIHMPLGGHKRYWISEYQFLDVAVPPLVVQREIVYTFNTAYCEIDLLKKIVLEYRNQKIVLMQKFIAGKWRISQ